MFYFSIIVNNKINKEVAVYMTTKLFERLVTKFSIKVNDLARYLEISKATIYNYRNLDEFSQIPNDKQYKIFYLFGKETEEELLLLLDENDKNLLKGYSDRIDLIFLAKAESKIIPNNLPNVGIELSKLDNIDDLSKKIVMEEVSSILSKLHNIEVKSFVDYLEIYNSHLDTMKK